MKTILMYRIRQFWQSFQRSPGQQDRQFISAILTPAELDLFLGLPIPDQNHSLRVLRTLLTQGEDDPDLLKSALLHDLGKMEHPLRRWERIFAVVINSVFPRLVETWGEDPPNGLNRPLAVLQQHPSWGAELAEKTGCSQRTVWLIRNHEMESPPNFSNPEEIRLLQKLQSADNNN